MEPVAAGAGALEQPGEQGEHRRRVAAGGGRLAGRQADLALGHGDAGEGVHHQHDVLRPRRGRTRRSGWRRTRRAGAPAAARRRWRRRRRSGPGPRGRGRPRGTRGPRGRARRRGRSPRPRRRCRGRSSTAGSTCRRRSRRRGRCAGRGRRWSSVSRTRTPSLQRGVDAGAVQRRAGRRCRSARGRPRAAGPCRRSGGRGRRARGRAARCRRGPAASGPWRGRASPARSPASRPSGMQRTESPRGRDDLGEHGSSPSPIAHEVADGGAGAGDLDGEADDRADGADPLGRGGGERGVPAGRGRSLRAALMRPSPSRAARARVERCADAGRRGSRRRCAASASPGASDGSATSATPSGRSSTPMVCERVEVARVQADRDRRGRAAGG